MKKQDMRIGVLSTLFVALLFFIILFNKNNMGHSEAVGYVLGAATVNQLELSPNNVIYVHSDTLKNNPRLWDAVETLGVEYGDYDVRIIDIH